ncbi:hypothetical protein BCT30_02040 [Enterovibrio norvegicus]|uniref:HNH endonuclease n=1 Tax=Enterovibrio norvegicus TaxID=188144 RepID=UPI000C867224|nr:HNH endonuclease [Enterovibrio norvegicus]MCC4799832.1 HNH endonuclease [Enterovibrio norvegicus]PMI36248.1 hypothetical protein BCU46_14775 [Enterovibrio norvegicus]PMN50985.1 hypothetical protein BCT30_02040 [Enterovibrio norvegicus]TKF09929.1 HNH endonuclease [Enterovibrio norvegicus]
MLKCIYCNNGKFVQGGGSEEHAILSSLGGRKISRNICCTDCNNRLGKSIDNGLSSQLSILSTLLNIKTGRNKSAPVQRDVVKLNGKSYNLRPSGEMLMGTVEKQWKSENGETKFRVVANTEEQALKIIEGKLNSHDKSTKKLKMGTVTEVSEYGAEISGIFSFCENDMRSIAKMSLTMLATKVSPERLRSGEFNDVIEYINGSDLNIEDIVFSDTNTNFSTQYKVSDINHRVFIYTSQVDALAISLVELYGGFRFTVLLSRQWSGPSLSCCYVIDPTTQEKIDCNVDSNLNLKSVIANRGCIQSKAIEQLKPLFDQISALDIQREEQRIISSILEKYNLNVLSEDCDDVVFREIANALTDMYLKRSSRQSRALL